MASKLPSSGDRSSASADDPAEPELDKKLLPKPDVAGRVVASKPASSSPADVDDEDDDDDDEEDELKLDDEDEEDLVVFTAKEAAGALATIYAFIKPFLKK